MDSDTDADVSQTSLDGSSGCCPADRDRKLKLFSYLYGVFFFLLAGLIASQMGPFFPLLAMEEKGLSSTSTGCISAAYDFASVISCLAIPQRLQVKDLKSFFIFALFIHGFCGVFFGCMEFVTVKARFFVGCFILRLLMGVGTSLAWFTFVPMSISWYPTQRTTIASYVENVFAIGIVFGPALGSLLYTWKGFALPFVVPGLVKVTMAFFAIFIMVDAEEARTLENKNLVESHDEDDNDDTDNDFPPPYSESDPMGYSELADKEEDENGPKNNTNESKNLDGNRNQPTVLGGENSPLLSDTPELKKMSVFSLCTYPIIVVASFPFMASASTVGFLGVFLSPFLTELYDIDQEHAALYFIITALFSVLISPIVGCFARNNFKWVLYLTGPYLGVIGFALIGQGCEVDQLHHKYLVMFCLCLIGWCYCTGYVTGFYVINDLVEAHMDRNKYDLSSCRAIVSAWVLINIMVGRILGNAISGGVVLQNLGFESAIYFQVALLLFGGIVGLISTICYSKSVRGGRSKVHWKEFSEYD